MARLYMLRHGETHFNRIGLLQGWCDSPLTDEGIEQAQRAGAWFRERGISFDHAYSSTSERASDTLEYAVPGMPYERVKNLREWHFGTFEGISRKLGVPRPAGDFYKQFGGEGEGEFRERIGRQVREIMARPGHESVLIVSHGAAIVRFPESWGCDIRPALGSRGLGNCDIVMYDYDGAGTFTFLGIATPCAEMD